LSKWFASVDWVSRSGVWSSVRAGVGCDANAGEVVVVVVVVGVVPVILVWGEGGWVRREIRRLKLLLGVMLLVLFGARSYECILFKKDKTT
jgi:hypothetical protein